MLLDTLIQGGTVHSEHGAHALDVGIINGRIAVLALPGTLSRSEAKHIIDASGCDVLPGCIDVHVHLALPFCGTVSCDDFAFGSRAAACGCVTSVIDFAIPSAGQSLRDAHEAWTAKAAGNSMIDYAWHLAVTRDEHLAEIPRMIDAGLPTFKEFMIYESEGWNSGEARLRATLALMKKHSGMLLVHAEAPRMLEQNIRAYHTPEEMRKHGARLHAMTRPHLVEAQAIKQCVDLCEETGGRLYVVHMSTANGANIVRDAHARGVNVLAETCVQYLVLDERVFDREDGHLFACCPQVKKQSDIDRLWRGVVSGEVSVVSTDTCSFTRAQKQMWWHGDAATGFGDFTKIPMGLPGLDTLVPLMYTQGVKQGRIQMRDLVRLCAGAPARHMGLWGKKGAILPGFDADIAIIDPRASKVVTPKNLQSACDWSPYEGMKLFGFATRTLVRGEVVVRDGAPVGDLRHGQFLTRKLG